MRTTGRLDVRHVPFSYYSGLSDFFLPQYYFLHPSSPVPSRNVDFTEYSGRIPSDEDLLVKVRVILASTVIESSINDNRMSLSSPKSAFLKYCAPVE